MGEPGSDRRGSNPDLAALPPELAKQSLSNAVIMLPREAALRAIAHLSQNGRCLENWEGWVKLPGGGRTKSVAHGGSFALARDPARAAAKATEGIERAHALWQRNPEYPGAELYYALTFGDA